MLQQTRVPTVLDYYEPFLKRFPDVEALARANHETVLKHWEGLGYYRRILHFHRAARELRRCRMDVPRTAAELRQLSGVGQYTAAAIASIAFGEPVAAVDGNVARVIARLFGIQTEVLSASGRRRVQSMADELLSPSRPGDFNQAWMDLGSLICTPKSPNCPRCPLRNGCVAARSGCAEEFPRRNGQLRRKSKHISLVVGVFERAGRFLLHRRALGGLWSGLWEFPTSEVHGVQDSGEVMRRLAKQEGIVPSVPTRKVGVVRHELTHRSMTFHVYVVPVGTRRTPKTTIQPATPSPLPDGRGSALLGGIREGGTNGARRWVDARGFGKLSVSTAHRKVFEIAGQALENHRGPDHTRRTASKSDRSTSPS